MFCSNFHVCVFLIKNVHVYVCFQVIGLQILCKDLILLLWWDQKHSWICLNNFLWSCSIHFLCCFYIFFFLNHDHICNKVKGKMVTWPRMFELNVSTWEQLQNWIRGEVEHRTILFSDGITLTTISVTIFKYIISFSPCI